MSDYTADDLDVGMTVEWHIDGPELFGPPIGPHDVQGTIQEMGLEKHGYSDMMRVECPDDPSGEVFLRPSDIDRIVD